jgi:formylglycine-generating enzyme required for sulfatase activity
MGKRSQPISIPLMLLLQQIGIISLLSLGSITVVKAESACKSAEIRTQISKLAVKGQAKDAAQALSQCGESAVPALIQAMKNPDVQVQLGSADTLAKIGKPSVKELTQVLNTASQPVEVRSLAIMALTQIAQTQPSEAVGIVQTFTERRLDKQENRLVRISAMRALDTLGTPAPIAWTEQVKNWIIKNSAVSIGLASIAGLGMLYLLILRMKPRWLLLMPENLKIPGTKIDVPIGVLRWLKYQPPVLDDWVKSSLPQVKDKFLAQPTVSDRTIHIPIQIKLGAEFKDALTISDLQPIFQQPPVCLMIVGEGGVGKTSLACQIARWGMGLVDATNTPHPRSADSHGSPPPTPTHLSAHLMLPVLIEQELEKTPLLTVIREQLPRTADGSFVADELLEALLKRQRVLVILDHVSEMKDDTYQQMQEALNKTPINALIITSRLPEKDLGRPYKTRLEPQKIAGARLSTFIQPYLERQGKRNIFEDDTEFYRTCTRLSSMMAATLQSATALLVRLYVDQVIDAGGLKTAQLPDNIPELMVKYLCWLNRPALIAKAHRREDEEIRQDAKVVAWKCLQESRYRPSTARYSDVIEALNQINPDQKAVERLTYLSDRLRLVQIEGDRVRIILDPVAEYLAAFYVIEQNQREDAAKRWQTFLDDLDTDPEHLPTIRGFLLAVRNCAEREGKKLPSGVLEQLNQRANLDPNELEQARRRQRINKLIDDLYDSDRRYVEQAIRNLKQEGTQAYKAIPDLLKVLRSPTIDPALRVEALTALMQIQSDRTALEQLSQELLSNRTDEPAVRVAAITTLLTLHAETSPSPPLPHSPTLPTLLRSHFDDPTEASLVRVRAGEGLRQLGLLSQLLVVELDAVATPTIRLLPLPKTRTVPLAEGIDLQLVQIPGGTFDMGTPEEDNRGFSEERPVHTVTIAEFWLGQVPVTQAQYEAVMGYNPASFRVSGANRPVETVSWHDAIAFCQKLSELTGQEFRLPTEAEWEYACRAMPSPPTPLPQGKGSVYPPFHWGKTITTDYANYRGTDWDYGRQIYPDDYGEGPKGIFRKQTTEVGSFPPNAFGLYDMHGNVWEWCLDHWHDNYQGAPSDGSAWIEGGDSRYRLLRGGSWDYIPRFCRSAHRSKTLPDNRDINIGFRVVCGSA